MHPEEEIQQWYVEKKRSIFTAEENLHHVHTEPTFTERRDWENYQQDTVNQILNGNIIVGRTSLFKDNSTAFQAIHAITDN